MSLTTLEAKAVEDARSPKRKRSPMSSEKPPGFGLRQSSGALTASLVLPKSVTSIGNGAFLGCNALVSATIDTAAIADTFSGLKNLTSVTIGNSVTSISSSAFSRCSALASISLPDSVTSIGNLAFSQCSGLTSISLPKSVTNMGGSAFSGCTTLATIALPNGLSGIPDQLFDGCIGLASIMLPDSVTNIGFAAFRDCTGLAAITVPKSVEGIGAHAFFGCIRLERITVDALNAHYSDRDGVLLDKPQTTLVQYPGGRGGSYVLPNSVASIGAEAFRSARGLTTLTLPSSVTSIGDWAFAGLADLTSVYFEGSSPTLGAAVFGSPSKAIVYYLAGTTGWGSTFAGRPTAVWVRRPSYSQWASAAGLPTKYPNASGEQDDADQDGLTNSQEMVASTDPTERTSSLVFEALARPGDLSEDDKGPIDPSDFALYFQSVPGQSYEIQSRDTLGSAWSTAASVTATTTQKRVRLIKPSTQKFYRVVIPGVTAGMVLIPGGSFTMGDTLRDGVVDEFPTHTVTVSAFYVDRFEVTKGLWDEVKTWAIEHGYSFDNDGAGPGANYPVELLNWYDAVKWCNARSEKEGRAPVYYTDEARTRVYRAGQVNVENSWVNWNGGYRLPTEAEWEKAARGGLSRKRFSWGDTITHSDANYFSSSEYPYDVSATRGSHPSFDADPMPYTSPVGWFSARANGYGLQDVAGNVAEWCWDWYGLYADGSVTDPRGPTTGSYRVYRGGAWSSNARDCRSAYRGHDWSVSKGDGLGFRSVLTAGQ